MLLPNLSTRYVAPKKRGGAAYSRAVGEEEELQKEEKEHREEEEEGGERLLDRAEMDVFWLRAPLGDL
jgi:hypothetical protein